MEDFEDSEFSAIYESVEDSGSDEYVTVSQPIPTAYLRPEPKMAAPPPPPLAASPEEGEGPASWEGGGARRPSKKRLKLRQLPLPPPLSLGGSSKTTPLLSAAEPYKPHPQPLPRQHQRSQKGIKYKRLGKGEGAGSATPPATRPNRPPKPGYLSSSRPPMPPPRSEGAKMSDSPSQQSSCSRGGSGGEGHEGYHQQDGNYQTGFVLATPTSSGVIGGGGRQGQTCRVSSDGEGAEPQNEYDSIKETRRMLAARKQHLAKVKGQGSDIRMHTIGGGTNLSSLKDPGLYDNEGEGEEEEEEGGKEAGLGGKVVCILLSITVVTLLIAVASTALSIYSFTGGARIRAVCHQTTITVVEGEEEESLTAAAIVMTPPISQNKNMVGFLKMASLFFPSLSPLLSRSLLATSAFDRLTGVQGKGVVLKSTLKFPPNLLDSAG